MNPDDQPQIRPEVGSEAPPAVRAWHRIAASRDPAGSAARLSDLLADEVVFRSPAVHRPQEGRELTTAYLSAAIVVLGPTLRYVREWYAVTSAVLEFEADLDGIVVHGIDMLTWDDADRLVEFTVMVRPMKGLAELVSRMGAELSRR